MSNLLPWPNPDSSIFNIRNHGSRCSSLEWARGQRYGYEEGYRRAAVVLFEHVEETGRGLESLIFPLAYIWRHAIELQLKRILVDGSTLQEVDPPKHYKHNLVDLWELAKPILVALDDVEPEGTDVVEHVLGEIQKLDPEDTGFRFHQNRKGEPNLEYVPSHFDVRNFHEVCTEVLTFLECGNSEISARLDWQAEMYAEMQKSYSP